MIIQRAQFQLRSIGKDDIEQIRQWRNAPDIVKFMEFKEEITLEMQELWWQKISQGSDYYFMIVYQGQSLGLIDLRLDGAFVGESGLFIGEDTFRGSPISYWSSLPLLDFGFNFLGLQEVTAKVHKDNTLARNYNESLGFVFRQEINDHFHQFSITPDVFSKKVMDMPAYQSLKNTYMLCSDQFYEKSPEKSGLFISIVKPFPDQKLEEK